MAQSSLSCGSPNVDRFKLASRKGEMCNFCQVDPWLQLLLVNNNSQQQISYCSWLDLLLSSRSIDSKRMRETQDNSRLMLAEPQRQVSSIGLQCLSVLGREVY